MPSTDISDLYSSAVHPIAFLLRSVSWYHVYNPLCHIILLGHCILHSTKNNHLLVSAKLKSWLNHTKLSKSRTNCVIVTWLQLEIAVPAKQAKAKSQTGQDKSRQNCKCWGLTEVLQILGTVTNSNVCYHEYSKYWVPGLHKVQVHGSLQM